MRGVKRPFDALFLSMLRMVILPFIIVYILVTQMGFGLSAIWWASFSAAFVIGTISYLHAKRLLPRMS